MTEKEMEERLKSLEMTLQDAIKERERAVHENTEWIGEWDKSDSNPPPNPLIDKWMKIPVELPWVGPKPYTPFAPHIPVPHVDTDTWPPPDVPGIEVGMLFIGKDKKLYIRTTDGDIALDSVSDIKKLVTKLLLQDKLDT